MPFYILDKDDNCIDKDEDFNKAYGLRNKHQKKMGVPLFVDYVNETMEIEE